MLAPVQPHACAPAPTETPDFGALLEVARVEALVVLHRLLTDTAIAPAVARELRMTATAILRVKPPNPSGEKPADKRPAAPYRPSRESDESNSLAPGHSDGLEPSATQSSAQDPFEGLSDSESIRLAEKILFPKRKRAAALHALAGAASPMDSG